MAQDLFGVHSKRAKAGAEEDVAGATLGNAKHTQEVFNARTNG